MNLQRNPLFSDLSDGILFTGKEEVGNGSDGVVSQIGIQQQLIDHFGIAPKLKLQTGTNPTQPKSSSGWNLHAGIGNRYGCHERSNYIRRLVCRAFAQLLSDVEVNRVQPIGAGKAEKLTTTIACAFLLAEIGWGCTTHDLLEGLVEGSFRVKTSPLGQAKEGISTGIICLR